MSPSHPARPQDTGPDGADTEVSAAKVSGAGVVEVEVTEAARLADAGLALLVDVGEGDEWAAGHAPAAVHVPLGNLPQTQLPADLPVLAICRSGNRSAAATALLLARGADACNVTGGMRAWQAAGLPVTTGHGPAGAAP